MITVRIQEYKTSNFETRIVPEKHAHSLGKNGGFYCVQLVNDFDAITAEYK